MATTGSVPDYIREGFRRDLIQCRGNSGAFGLGYAEELRRFGFYLNTFEKFISEQEKAEVTALEKDADNLSEERRDEFWPYYYPVHWDEIFRSNLRPAFLISLISFIEAQLHTTCRDVAIIGHTPIVATDLKGGFLDRSRMFLSKFGGFQHSSPTIWAEISSVYDVRNVFVHHAGYFAEYKHKNRLRQFIREHNDLFDDGNPLLCLTQNFCPFALHVTERFMNSISKDVAALCERTEMSEWSAKK